LGVAGRQTAQQEWKRKHSFHNAPPCRFKIPPPTITYFQESRILGPMHMLANEERIPISATSAQGAARHQKAK
jgi:hypothetical protein